MKKRLSLLLIILIFACNSDKKKNNSGYDDNEATYETKANTSSSSKSEVVTKFLNNVRSLKRIEGNPISVFKAAAARDANQVLTISKGNIANVLATARQYKHCVITTENHTIVKIISFDNCKPSGSWETCMPFAKGFIKKGELLFQKDYINNIIGTPDSQERKAYLFN